MNLGKFDRVFWYDLETTGLDKNKNHIMQLSYIIDVCGDTVLERDIKFKPYSTEHVSEQALKVTGVDKNALLSRDVSAKDAFHTLLTDLEKHKGGLGKGSPRYVSGGYNVAVFDKWFLTAFFDLNLLNRSWAPRYYYYFYQQPVLDVMYFYMPLALTDLQLKTWHEKESFKLENVYKLLLDGEINAHDALADVKATREVYYALTAELNL